MAEATSANSFLQINKALQHALVIRRLSNYVDSTPRRVPGHSPRVWVPNPRHWFVSSLQKSQKYEICSQYDSFWTLLPLRTRRRTYRVCETTAYSYDLLCYWDPSPPLASGWLPIQAFRSQHRVACGVFGQHAALSYCEALGSFVFDFLWYSYPSPLTKEGCLV